MFEVPLPLADDQRKRGAAVEHLGRARDLFLQGHYDDAVANCRKALEALARSLGDAKELRRVQDTGNDREARERFTVRERILAVRNATFQAANLANHAPPGATSDYGFRQSDVRLILAATAALIAHALQATPGRGE